MRLYLLTASVALLISAPLEAQRAVASSALNVRRGQSVSSTVVGHIDAGDTVALVAPAKRKGYYHVQLADGTVGWAWAARLSPVSEGVVAAPPPPVGSPPAAAGASTVTGAINLAWTRTPSNATDIHWPTGDHALCQAVGQGGDGPTNFMKNRTDEPSAYHAVSWDALQSLPFPHNQKKRRSGPGGWTPSELAELAKFEGTPISVEAFLSGVKEELPGKDRNTGQLKKGESTNCGENTSPRVDWHMYLTKHPNESHKLAIVVETTPRVRPAHPNWTLAEMQQLSTDGTPVRISGWLMFDPEHWDQMWKYKGAADTTGTKARITLREIHPITKIEVKKNGQWTSLDAP